MKQLLKRLVTLALALTMLLSVWPAELGGSSALAVGAYGKTIADGVRVRKQPSTDAAYWFKIDMDYVCALLDVTTKGGVTWYKVNVEHPDPDSTRTYIGYIHGDFFKLLTDEEAAAYEAGGTVPATPTATPAPTATTAGGEGNAPTGVPTATPAPTATVSGGNTPAHAGATGQVTNGGVNFRETEGGRSLFKLDRGTVVEILTIPPVIDENHWYKVRYDGVEGYIMSTFLRVVSTGDPNATVDPDPETSEYGYVKLILSSANLRLTPGGDIGAQWEKTGEVLEIAGEPVEARGYIWYPVMYGGKLYYVREDTVQLQATAGAGGTATGPTATPGATVVGYVKTTAAGVNLRLTPGGESIMQIKRGVVLPVLAPVTTAGGYAWYYVQTADNVRGYVRGDCVTVCNADGSAVAPNQTPAATQAPAVAYGYVKTIVDKVNLRTKPTGSSQEQIALGVVLPMTGQKIKSGIYDWYPVKAASGRTGYVRGDCVVECNEDGSALGATATPVPTSTVTGGTQPTATPAPTNSVSSYGYVQITKTSTNLRKTAGGSKIGSLEKGTVWPLTGPTTTANGYTWYPVNVNGLMGYVRGDCCFKLSATQQESYLAGNGVPTETAAPQVQYVITTVDKVHLRAAATKDSESKFNVPIGTVMAYKTTATVGGSVWYRVVYSNTEVWVLGSCVKVMTSAEYENYLASNPASTPQVEVIAGYVKTIVDKVNLRKTAGGAVIGSVAKDQVFSYSRTETAKGYTWYYANTSSGYGFLRGDCVMECKADGSSLGVTTPPTGSGQEASYTTLRRGSTGTAVRNLVQELINQGYYTGPVTSTYTSAVEDAVRRFQAAKGLTVDGIAGPATQHALFGTVPIGSGSGSDLTMTIYPAEKIDWFTGGIQQLWPKGADHKIYDVKTGIVWWAHRWSGANHADIEPLTAADTAKLCKMYGVSSADKINYEDHWHRRPSLVTIGTRTFACSLDGVPHNPDGDTISTNDMIGQICLHFTNSKGHESGVVSDTHQEAIEYAYLHAPNGHK